MSLDNLETTIEITKPLIDTDTRTEEVDQELFLAKVKNEKYSVKSIQKSKELDNTYYDNFDKAQDNESVEDLKDLTWKIAGEFIVPIQKWLGVVTNVDNKKFSADLEDLSNEGTKESAEFERSEVDMSERYLIEKGAIFYYYIAYITRNGTKLKPQIIRFKRPVKWSNEEFEFAMNKADSMYTYFLNKTK